MSKIVMISVMFLFLAGCGSYEICLGIACEYMSLDEALAQAQNIPALENLRRQATSEDDKAIIDQKIVEYRQELQIQQEWNRKIVEYRQRQAAHELQIQQEWNRKNEELKRLASERAERDRIEFETNRKELIQNGGGTLRDKSAQQVKKLVDSWKKDNYWGWQQEVWKIESKFSSTETFYEVFGTPPKTQLLSETKFTDPQGYEQNIVAYKADYYYFLYRCKDGAVQIKVDAYQLDNNNIVIIEGLNIF